MFSRPTLKQLQERIESDFSARLLSGQNLLSRSVLKVVAIVYAGACHLMYGFFIWAFKQGFPDTAEKDYMERWAFIWNIVRRQGAKAEGMAIAKGLENSVVPANTQIKSQQNVFYTVKADAYPDFSGNIYCELEAQEIGDNGNQESGVPLQFVVPIVGVETTILVAENGIEGGVDVEDDESLRYRTLLALREPPMGGNESDYVKWALEVPGVTRAWAFANWLGLGSVGVTFVNDDDVDIIPPAELVQRVQEYIDAVRPLCAVLTVFAPEKKVVDMEIILEPYSENLAELVRLELYDLFVREGAVGQVIPVSHINEAISITTGEFDHVLLSPTENIIPQKNEIPVIGTIIIRGSADEISE